MRWFSVGIAGVTLALALACGSTEEGYKMRVEDLTTLQKALGPEDQAALATQMTAFQERYAALPAEATARDEALGKLNQDMRAVQYEFQAKVDQAQAANAGAAAAEGEALKKEIVGSWRGGDVSIVISADGGVHYERKGATSSEITAPIQAATANTFDVGLFGIVTTFHVDERPHMVDGVRHMKLDGVDLVEAP